MQEQPQGGRDHQKPKGLGDHPLHQTDAALGVQPALAVQQPALQAAKPEAAVPTEQMVTLPTALSTPTFSTVVLPAARRQADCYAEASIALGATNSKERAAVTETEGGRSTALTVSVAVLQSAVGLQRSSR